MIREKLLRKTISTYGTNSQLDMAVEEMSELTKEVCKYKRGKENRTEILEEVADVKIMLEQFQIIFRISDEEIERMIVSKLDRLRIRLERVIEDEK